MGWRLHLHLHLLLLHLHWLSDNELLLRRLGLARCQVHVALPGLSMACCGQLRVCRDLQQLSLPSRGMLVLCGLLLLLQLALLRG